MIRQIQNRYRSIVDWLDRDHAFEMMMFRDNVQKFKRERISDIASGGRARIIYRIFVYAANTITFGGSAAFLSFWFTYKLTGKPEDLKNFQNSLLLTAVGLICFVAIYILKKTYGKTQRFMPDMKLPGTYIEKHKHSKGLFKINCSSISSGKFKFADKEDAAISAIINVRAFQNTIWQSNHLKKFIRNKGHIVRNGYTIQLIKSLTINEYIGFTHIIPVSKRVWSMYVNSKIEDNSFDEDYVLPREVPVYEDVYGLIMFSFGYAFADPDRNPDVAQGTYYGDLMEQALARHLNHFLDTTFSGNTKVKVLFTNSDDVSLIKFQEEALNGEMKSKDKTNIYIFEVTNML